MDVATTLFFSYEIGGDKVWYGTFFFPISEQISQPAKRWCCDWIWWINQPASPNPLRAGCLSVDSPDRPSLPRARLHPSPAAGTFSNLPATCYCTPIWLRCLSSANLWQWAREHRTLRPSSVGSSRCHGWRTLPVPLRQKGATSFSRLRKCFSQRCMRTHKMRVRPPPLQMGQKL